MVCPTHLVEKWIRETKLTIPEVLVIDLSVRNVISIMDRLRDEMVIPQIYEVYVISKERAKLSYGWRPAAVKKSGSKFPHCPDSGSIAMKGDEYVTWSNIYNKRYHCSNCGSALWQADRKLRRFAPAEYIKRYLKKLLRSCNP